MREVDVRRDLRAEKQLIASMIIPFLDGDVRGGSHTSWTRTLRNVNECLNSPSASNNSGHFMLSQFWSRRTQLSRKTIRNEHASPRFHQLKSSIRVTQVSYPEESLVTCTVILAHIRLDSTLIRVDHTTQTADGANASRTFRETLKHVTR